MAGHWLPKGAYGVADGPNLDSFSRVRVSDPTTLFAAQCQYDADPLLFESGATGTGSAGVGGTSACRVVFNYAEVR